jgi:hypothetical protein
MPDQLPETHRLNEQAARATEAIRGQIQSQGELPTASVTYTPYPEAPSGLSGVTIPTRWRIQLINPNGDDAIGLDLYGEVLMGRGNAEGIQSFIDLSAWGAAELGVSRQHMLLRATPAALQAIDVGSTNGVYQNGVRITLGIPCNLADGDIILLGNLALILRIIAQPGAAG